MKSEADSAALVLHRARDFLVGQVTQVGNAIRAHMAEFGIVPAKGSKRVASLVEELNKVPEAASQSHARLKAVRKNGKAQRELMANRQKRRTGTP